MGFYNVLSVNGDYLLPVDLYNEISDEMYKGYSFWYFLIQCGNKNWIKS
jgi:hypothetical protein